MLSDAPQLKDLFQRPKASKEAARDFKVAAALLLKASLMTCQM
jgi:hypothetical protein